MPKLGTYWLSRLCAWGFAGSYALLALAGVIGRFTPDSEFLGLNPVGWCVTAFASVIVFSILGANVSSAAIMRAITGPGGWRNPHWPTLITTAVCMLIYMSASYIGMHFGWEVLIADAPETALPSKPLVHLILLLLPWAKPLSMLAIAGCEAMDQARLDEEKRAEQERADRIADKERDHQHIEKLANLATKGSAKHSISDTARITKSRRRTRTSSSSEKAPPPSPEARARARLLLAEGHKPLEVHKRTGVPHGTVKRLASELRKQPPTL